MPLPLPFDPNLDLPTLRQRLEWADAGLLDGVSELKKPPMYEYEYEIWPLGKEWSEEAVESARVQIQNGLIPVAGSCRCGVGAG